MTVSACGPVPSSLITGRTRQNTLMLPASVSCMGFIAPFSYQISMFIVIGGGANYSSLPPGLKFCDKTVIDIKLNHFICSNPYWALTESRIEFSHEFQWIVVFFHWSYPPIKQTLWNKRLSKCRSGRSCVPVSHCGCSETKQRNLCPLSP